MINGSIQLWLILGIQLPLAAQQCRCGAPCDVLLESQISSAELHQACNTVAVLGARVLPTGTAEIHAGRSITLSGLVVESGGELIVVLDPLLSCEAGTDADLDGVNECLDCDEADPNNWVSCAACVDGDLDGAFANCDSYVTLDGPDCRDGDGSRHPGATEICDGIDDDCDGLVDECLTCPVPLRSNAEAGQ